MVALVSFIVKKKNENEETEIKRKGKDQTVQRSTMINDLFHCKNSVETLAPNRSAYKRHEWVIYFGVRYIFFPFFFIRIPFPFFYIHFFLYLVKSFEVVVYFPLSSSSIHCRCSLQVIRIFVSFPLALGSLITVHVNRSSSAK